MNRPVLSPNFTVEDIHKLREYNYYQTKDMSRQDIIILVAWRFTKKYKLENYKKYKLCN